jgi:hypothetical protein
MSAFRYHRLFTQFQHGVTSYNFSEGTNDECASDLFSFFVFLCSGKEFTVFSRMMRRIIFVS